MYKPEGQLTNYKNEQSFSKVKMLMFAMQNTWTTTLLIRGLLAIDMWTQVKGVLPVAFSCRPQEAQWISPCAICLRPYLFNLGQSWRNCHMLALWHSAFRIHENNHSLSPPSLTPCVHTTNILVTPWMSKLILYPSVLTWCLTLCNFFFF